MKRKKIISQLLFCSIIMCTLWQCANPVSLTGGPRDEKEPTIIEEKSTANYQTNFENKIIEIEFDEFIDLKDIFNNVLISPPTLKNPKITSRGKKMKIEFDEEEVLKEEATYVLNFGDAIRDFTESNILKNYRFVFSTGDYIDSLEISGVVTDVISGKPVEDINVMLYVNLADSVVRSERPFYFATTDKEGKYTIQNLRADTFKLFALKDANLNYLYDQATEAIGFQDDLVVVNDSTQGYYPLELFIAQPKFSVKENITSNFGEIKLLFSETPKDVMYKSDIDTVKFITEIDNDTLLLWYDMSIDTGMTLMVEQQAHEFVDTFSLRKYKRADFLRKQTLHLKSNSLNIGNKLKPTQKLSLTFSYPIESFEMDSMTLLIDSIPQEFSILKDSSSFRSILIESAWQQDSSYTFLFKEGTVVDIYGRKSRKDSVKFEVFNETLMSKIKVIYNDLDSLNNHLVILQQSRKTIDQVYLQKVNSGEITFDELIPGTYQLELIKDENGNRKWDPGDYDTKKQSERTIAKELEKLRENWELEVILNGSDFIKTISQDTTTQNK